MIYESSRKSNMIPVRQNRQISMGRYADRNRKDSIATHTQTHTHACTRTKTCTHIQLSNLNNTGLGWILELNCTTLGIHCQHIPWFGWYFAGTSYKVLDRFIFALDHGSEAYCCGVWCESSVLPLLVSIYLNLVAIFTVGKCSRRDGTMGHCDKDTPCCLLLINWLAPRDFLLLSGLIVCVSCLFVCLAYVVPCCCMSVFVIHVCLGIFAYELTVCCSRHVL